MRPVFPAEAGEPPLPYPEVCTLVHHVNEMFCESPQKVSFTELEYPLRGLPQQVSVISPLFQRRISETFHKNPPYYPDVPYDNIGTSVCKEPHHSCGSEKRLHAPNVHKPLIKKAVDWADTRNAIRDAGALVSVASPRRLHQRGHHLPAPCGRGMRGVRSRLAPESCRVHGLG